MMPEFSLGTIIKIFSLLLEVFLGQLMLCKILTPKTFRLRIPCITGIFCVHAIFLLLKNIICQSCMAMSSGSIYFYMPFF